MAENSWHSNVGKYAIHGAHEYGHHHHYTKQIITIIALYYTTLLMSCSCYCKLQYSGNYATNHWYEYAFVVCIMFTSSAALWKCITSWLILFLASGRKGLFQHEFWHLLSFWRSYNSPNKLQRSRSQETEPSPKINPCIVSQSLPIENDAHFIWIYPNEAIENQTSGCPKENVKSSLVGDWENQKTNFWEQNLQQQRW